MTNSSLKYTTIAIIAIATIAGLSASSITPALAVNPHFVSASASVSSSGQLACTFKEAGLGDNQLINYQCSGTATALYQCFNNGGNHPKAANKETVTSPVSGSGQFNSGRNGQVTGSIPISNTPPGPGSFSCPSGQSLFLQSVSFTGMLTDQTNGVSTDIQVSRTLHIPV